MARLGLVALALLLPIVCSLDCRKFSFAPACRGIMLKRSQAPEPEISPEDVLQAFQDLEAVESLVKQAETLGKDCVPLSWFREKLSSQTPKRAMSFA